MFDTKGYRVIKTFTKAVLSLSLSLYIYIYIGKMYSYASVYE